MKELAWEVTPICPYQDIPNLSYATKLTNASIKQYIKELEEEKILIHVSGSNMYNKAYALNSALHIQLLNDIKKDPKEFLNRKRSNYFVSWESIQWKNAIQEFVTHGTLPDLDTCYILDSYEQLSLIRQMLEYQEWIPFFNNLPVKNIRAIFERIAFRWNEELSQPDMDILNRGFLKNETLPASIRDQCISDYAFYEYVLPARLKEYMEAPQPDTPMHQCISALCTQYQGKAKEAVQLYQKALKGLGTTFFGNTFYNTYYILALIQEGSSTSWKKLGALSRRKELNGNFQLTPVKLLIWNGLKKDTDEIMPEIKQAINYMPRLSNLMTLLLLRHLHLDNGINMDEASICGQIDKEELKLLQLEFSQDFAPFAARADKLKKQTQLCPLLPPCKKMEPWERAIAELMEKTRPAQKNTPASVMQESQSRIIYQVNRYGLITPILQKSKDGVTWSKGRNIALSTFQSGLPEMNEKDKAMAGHVKHYTYNGWGRNEFWELRGEEAMAELAGYPLVFSSIQPGTPVVITREKLQITVTQTQSGFRIEHNAGENINQAFAMQVENDFLFHIMELSGAQRDLLGILSKNKEFPQKAEKQLAELLPQLSQVMTVHSDLLQDKNQLKQVKANAQITVLMQPVGEGIKADLFVKPFTDQPPYCQAGKGNVSVIGTVKEKKVQAIRDLKKEQQNLKQLMEWLQPLGERTEYEDNSLLFEDTYQCLDLLEILQEHLEDIRIEWPQGVKVKLKGKADMKNLSLSVKGIGQWFELEGELKTDDGTILRMAELLQKVRESKGRFITLSDGEFIALTDNLRKQLQTIDPILTEEKGKLRLPMLTASSLQEMEGQGAALNTDDTFNRLIRRMEEAEKEAFPLPHQLKAELRNYQTEGFEWMSRLAYWGAGACLADDMGLGKTLQTIALLLKQGKQGASLVVVPASILLNWRNELERFAPSLTPLVMKEVGCDRKALVDNASEYDVVLTTYGLLVNEAEILTDKKWNIVVLDEAHVIKNKETKMSKAAMGLRGNFRLMLTGTPLQNHLGEIWNLFQFANPGLLGTFRQFTERFINPIEKEGDKSRQRRLKRLLQPFILRRTKTEVLDELPQKTEITLHVELGEPERALYENLRRTALNNLEEGATAIQALSEITKLRQAACHPSLVQPELNLPSAKCDAFLKLVEELKNNQHRALVFSQFTAHLELIRKELDKAHINYLYLDGSTPLAEREKLVKAFQTGEQPLFLISLKAGGLGLNLTAADFVIHLDPWWNPAIENQASDRAYRIGQTRPVTVYRLIATQTIEEKILRLHQTKKSLADSLLDGSDMAHKLSKEELLELLKEANGC